MWLLTLCNHQSLMAARRHPGLRRLFDHTFSIFYMP